MLFKDGKEDEREMIDAVEDIYLYADAIRKEVRYLLDNVAGK